MTVLTFESHKLDLVELYARMWSIATEQPDGTRLFQPRPGGREALKWLIEDLSGAEADPVRTTRANNALRSQAHQALLELGWAERINQMSFRLLERPERVEGVAPAKSAQNSSPEMDEDGGAVSGVTVDAVTTNDVLQLAGAEWSDWHPLSEATQVATTSPGVYVARSGGDIVYIGMAGERRGKGVRGRLTIYARGRAAVSGLGEAALDRALADPAWIAQRLVDLHTQGPQRTKQWAVDALQHADLELCWTATADEPAARQLETAALQELEDVVLWNRARPKPTSDAGDGGVN